jgi:hypothetical protein
LLFAPERLLRQFLHDKMRARRKPGIQHCKAASQITLSTNDE